MYSIGVDLGGTKICTGVIDDSGRLAYSVETPTLAAEGPDAVIERIKGTIDEVLQHVPNAEVAGIGIGSPGPLNPYTGLVLGPPNLPGWDAIPLRTEIAATYPLPVFLANDANAAAIAEHQFGAGRGTRHMVYVTVSTGIGAGVIIDGKIRQGLAGSFGELGHMIVDRNGPVCACGNRGCLETFSSGTAIARCASEAFGEPLDARQVAQLAAEGDASAAEILDTAFVYLGIGLVNAVNLFDPEIIVLGGGVSQIGAPLLNAVRTALAANKYHHSSDQVKVLPAQLGTRAGVIGAAAIPLLHQDN